MDRNMSRGHIENIKELSKRSRLPKDYCPEKPDFVELKFDDRGCHFTKIIIKKKITDVFDFGDFFDSEPWNAPLAISTPSCGWMIFIPRDNLEDLPKNKEYRSEIFEKYNITSDELYWLQEYLQYALIIGICNLCNRYCR